MRNFLAIGLNLLICAAAIPGPTLARAETWAIYRDSIYGCRLEYPSSLFTQQPLDVAEDFQRFSGPDPQTYFRVMSGNNEDSLTPAGVKAKYLASNVPGEIVYDRTKTDFVVLSGYRADSIFYMKVALSKDQTTLCILEIIYPRTAKLAFDEAVTRMSRSFAAGK